MSVSITINNAVKRFGKKTIIPDLSLTVQQGEFFTLLGSSGCGKTTLLRMIAGFNTIEGGDFYFDDRRINDLPAHKRNIGMVFQNYAVFPHMNVEKNVGFGLKERKVVNPEYAKRVDEILNVVQISELKDRLPSEMSGGQQQRVALARAIVIEPDVLLMDEPLSNLDAKLRIEMRLAIKRIQNRSHITTIYVTHDQEEALSMSDRIAVMDKGVIQQVGTPIEIYSRPRNMFVATFIGLSNTMDGSITIQDSKKYITLYGKQFALPGLGEVQNGQKVKVVLRPNDMAFEKDGIPGRIVERIYLGSQIRYTVEMEDGKEYEVHLDTKIPMEPVGQTVKVAFHPEHANVYDADSGLSVMAREEKQ